VLKPREPDAFNGTADVQAFHKFMQQITDYLDGYDIHPSRQAVTVSNFLTDKAYEFYVVMVSRNPRVWTLRQLFIELFNYCFPVDFRMKMRQKLRKCYQKDKSVLEFIHELESLFMMAGVLFEQEQVDKLWTGLNTYIQKGLWHEKLSPTTASWQAI
ncbi:hypothetical protein OBBRIDRAFT_697230, partial [Obba rivulosa]